MKSFFIVCGILFNPVTFGANILFLFAPGNISHKLGVWPFVKGLAEAGHNVTFVSSGDKKLGGSELIRDVTPITFKRYTETLYSGDRLKDRLDGREWDIGAPEYDDMSFQFCETTMKAYQEEAEFQSVIDSGHYDLAITDAVFGECSLLLAHHLGLKVIIYSPSTLFPFFHGSFGAPVEASTIPGYTAEYKSHPPGLIDRMWNVYRHSFGYTRRDAFSDKLQALYRQNFKTEGRLPSLLELERNAALVFINTHYSTDYARSLPPVFISIGGMQCWEEVGKLPKEMNDFFNGAQDGVVLITFGSTIDLSTLDSFYVNIFFETMREFSTFRFIWRWDGPMPIGHPTNLMASKWLPQRAILDHSKTVAFMTHGGLNGINEATFHGIPMIVLPLFADQDFHAYRIQAQELGVSIELREFSQELMDGAFKEVLGNKKYKKNMEVRSKMFKDRRMSPVKEAIFWTEFVLRQDDTSALKPMLLEQPWHVRNLIDVYFVFFLLFTIVPLLILFGILRTFNMVFK